MSQSSDPVFNQIIEILSKINKNHDIINEKIKRALDESGINNTGELTIHERRTIRYIGEHKISNATSIASGLGITRGGISKICSRLISKSMITAHQMEGNRKEIFYRLTAVGDKIYNALMEYHRNTENKCREIIDSYTDEQKDMLLKFLSSIATLI
jgi:DNA-binding MarR family transcriptional regulator